jgi:hypothetical protein
MRTSKHIGLSPIQAHYIEFYTKIKSSSGLMLIETERKLKQLQMECTVYCINYALLRGDGYNEIKSVFDFFFLPEFTIKRFAL